MALRACREVCVCQFQVLDASFVCIGYNSLFRRFIVLKVHYTEGRLFGRFVIPEVRR